MRPYIRRMAERPTSVRLWYNPPMAGEQGRLAGRRAVVTGAASGIGRAIAGRFVQEGARTVVLDVDGAALADLAASLGDAVVAHAAVDVTDGPAVTEAVRAAAEALGGIDVVVNNAGIPMVGAVRDLTDEDWDRALDVDLKSVFLVSRAAWPHLEAGGRRRDRQHGVDRRDGRHTGPGRLRDGEGRRRDAHEVHGAGRRRGRDPRQRGLAGLRRHADARALARRPGRPGARPAPASRRCTPWVGSASRATSPTPSSTSRRTKRAGSRAPRSPSTAASAPPPTHSSSPHIASRSSPATASALRSSPRRSRAWRRSPPPTTSRSRR